MIEEEAGAIVITGETSVEVVIMDILTEVASAGILAIHEGSWFMGCLALALLRQFSVQWRILKQWWFSTRYMSSQNRELSMRNPGRLFMSSSLFSQYPWSSTFRIQTDP